MASPATVMYSTGNAHKGEEILISRTIDQFVGGWRSIYRPSPAVAAQWQNSTRHHFLSAQNLLLQWRPLGKYLPPTQGASTGAPEKIPIIVIALSSVSLDQLAKPILRLSFWVPNPTPVPTRPASLYFYSNFTTSTLQLVHYYSTTAITAPST